MFLPEFGLTVQPFGISPRLEFLYKSGAFEESIAHLVYGLDNSEAIVMITGAIGTGKTMAIQSFLSYLGDRYVSALVTNTSVDAKELLKLVLEDLGSTPVPGSDKSDLLIAFKKLLIASGREGKRIVIVIDEAQNLSREVLEEVRLLTNLGQGDEQPVQIILVGQPELETAVQRPDLAQLKQRIRVHYKLAPLSRQELQEYVDHRMVVAGGEAGVFTGGALDRIYERSGGVPRVVNTLCGEALLSAYVAGRRKVEARDLDDQAEPTSAPTPRFDPEPVPAIKPAEEIPRGEMAVRRESRVVAVPPAKPRTARAVDSETSRKSGRGRGWVVVAVAVAAVVVALVATGQFRQLWSRLPFADGSPEVAVTTPHGERAQPVAEPTASPNLEATLAAVPVSPDAPDSSAVAPPNPGPDAAAAVVETPMTSSANNPGASKTPVGGRVSAPETNQPAVANASEPPREVAAGTGEYFIHVSSFRTPEHAGAVARQFTASGLLAVVRQQLVRDVQWYRVYLGPFASHEDAVRLANNLRDEGTITYYKVIRSGADDGS